MTTLLALAIGLLAPDAKLTDLKDGYVKVETPAYSFEVPKGWAVGSETPWGARDLKPASGPGALSAMTAGPTNASWDQLYNTSLYFIQREGPGKATPYRTEKTKQGYEACTFTVLDASDFPARRYVLLKAPSGKVLALSVKIPSKANAKTLEPIFDRFVKSARIAD